MGLRFTPVTSRASTVEIPSDLPVGTRVGLMAAANMAGVEVSTTDLRAARRVQQVVLALQQHQSPKRRGNGDE